MKKLILSILKIKIAKNEKIGKRLAIPLIAKNQVTTLDYNSDEERLLNHKGTIIISVERTKIIQKHFNKLEDKYIK